MSDLKGKKIGLSKSLNTLKNDWWRVTEEQGIELMLRMNGMTRGDVQIVEFPYPDDWYGEPKMLAPFENPTELWLTRDHKHDLSACARWTLLVERGWMRSTRRASTSSICRRRPASSRRSRTFRAIRTGRSRSCNVPADFTCQRCDGASNTPSSWSRS